MRHLAPLLLMLGLLSGHGAAQAVEPHTHAPSIAYPLVNLDGTVAHRVRVEAGRLTWQSKRAARRWDALVDGLSVEVGPCVPDVPCVRVYAGRYDASWAGLLTFPDPGARHVLLNRATTGRQDRARVAMHELGHALGLGHHDQPRGLMCARPAPCDTRSWDSEPTVNEVAVLNDYFKE